MQNNYTYTILPLYYYTWATSNFNIKKIRIGQVESQESLMTDRKGKTHILKVTTSSCFFCVCVLSLHTHTPISYRWAESTKLIVETIMITLSHCPCRKHYIHARVHQMMYALEPIHVICHTSIQLSYTFLFVLGYEPCNAFLE